MSGSPRARWRRAVSVLVAVAAGALPSCSREENEPAPTAPEGLVLEFDGLRIWEHEVEPLRQYIAGIDRRAGRITVLTMLLDDYLIPLKAAQRAFAEQRAAKRELAEGLARAVGNEGYMGLLQKGRAVAGEEPDTFSTRIDLPLPLAQWAFADDNLGQVSPVLETPQGFSIISTEQIDRGTTRRDDLAKVYQVSFHTHDPEAFSKWYSAIRTELASTVTYVHPDYRRALPPWMTP